MHRNTCQVKWTLPSYGIGYGCRSFTHLTGDLQQAFQGHSVPTCCYSSTHLHRHPVQVCSQFRVQLKWQGQNATVPLLVVEGSGPSLFGRDWLSHIKLDWKKICSICVSDASLPQDILARLRTTIQSHPNVFKPSLGTIKGITAKLEMKAEGQPRFHKALPVPYTLQEGVEAEYNRLQSEGIVEKVEFSKWATPMVHVPKADGTTQSCGDYAVTVNPQLRVPQYPIPLPEDVFVKLRGGQRFTKLDLKSAYQQLPLHPNSQQFVTLNTHRGLYRYKRLPFGIASSRAIFQHSMDVILQGLDHVASIQDDILITGQDDDQHIKNLNTILSRLDDYGLLLQLSKYKLMQKSITYMGCIISAEGISPTDEKVEVIKQVPRPESSTQLRAFLGMVNYHGKFILFRRKFTLHTDHKPLLKIFAPDSATPVLAAARLQRWSLLLSSYHYEIEFKPSAEVPNADALSRLPLKYHRDASFEDTVFHVAAQQLSRIARETSRNPTMAKALLLTRDGWPVNFCPAPELKPSSQDLGSLVKLSATMVHHASLQSTRNFCSKMASRRYWALLTILHPIG